MAPLKLNCGVHGDDTTGGRCATCDAIRDQHGLLLTTSAPGLGAWSECECGWISPGYVTEARAEAAHARHVERAMLR